MSNRDLLAAEYALGLLEGEDLQAAQSFAACDPDVAAAVAWWDDRFGSMFAEIGEEAPPGGVWRRIQQRIATLPSDAGNVLQLKRRVGFWKGVSLATSAIAASLAFVMVSDFTQRQGLVETSAAPVMVASLMTPSKDVVLSAACEPDGRTLTLMPGEMAPTKGGTYRLWLIPADGRPRSLGVVGMKAKRMTLAPEIVEFFRHEPMLALTLEPDGSSPGGVPGGPIVASGQLRNV